MGHTEKPIDLHWYVLVHSVVNVSKKFHEENTVIHKLDDRCGYYWVVVIFPNYTNHE